jgi:NTE family protein
MPPSARPRAAGRSDAVALVCAGGGVTGAVYEIGCLRALDDLLDRSPLDLDLFVGVSGGAFVTSLLAAGVTPRELYAEVTGSGSRLGTSAAPLFRVGLGDLLRRCARIPKAALDLARETLAGRHALPDVASALFELLPSGLLDNSGVADFLAAIFRERGVRDRFDALHRELLVVAVDLDRGEAVPFGARGRRNVAVSRAVQASTALPGLYRPVRIGRREYVDGGVRKTAHINLAIQRGARLVFCINPIVPILNDGRRRPLAGHLSEKGIAYVLDQAFRIMLHGRMQYGLERYSRDFPDVDILLVEPLRHEMPMFRYNIMRYGVRRVVAEHGYRSVVLSFRANRARYERLLRRHGIRMKDPFAVPDLPPRTASSGTAARRLEASLDRLESNLAATTRRRRPIRTRRNASAPAGRR